MPPPSMPASTIDVTDELQVQGGLGPLFSDAGYTELLEAVISCLSIGEISRLIRVNKHVNHTFTSSSRFQLRYRKAFHALPLTRPPPYQPEHPARMKASNELAKILEREERLDTLNPSSVSCIHVPHSRCFDLQRGYMLMGGSLHKTPKSQDDPEAGYKFDGFSVWKMGQDDMGGGGGGGDGDEERKRGGFTSQGFGRWRTDVGWNWDAVSMCPEDNVVAVSKEINEVPCSDVGPNSSAFSMRRVYFYTMVPPQGTPTPAHNTFRGGLRHPEAKVPFIEIRVPAKYHMHGCVLRLGNNGRLGLSMISSSAKEEGFCGVWDWKKGVSLGAISSSPHMTVAIDVRFFGPFLITSCFCAAPNASHLRNSKRRARSSTRTKAKAPRDIAKKIGKGYKVGKGTEGTRSSRRASFDDSEDDYGSDYDYDYDYDYDSDYGYEDDDDVSPIKMEKTFCCFATYELLKPSNGSHPSPFAHQAYTEEGYDPNEPCTWDYDELPGCQPLVSFMAPQFNTMPSKSDMMQRMLFAEIGLPSRLARPFRAPAIMPSGCFMGNIDIDDALIRGERDGVMSFTIAAVNHEYDHRDEPLPLSCQGTIDLREIINRITCLLMDRVAAKSWDKRGHTVQTDIDTMWSSDRTVMAALKSRLTADKSLHVEEDAWETDDEDSWELSSEEPKGKQKEKKSESKSKRKGKGEDGRQSAGSSSPQPFGENKAADQPKYPLKQIFWEDWSHACSIRHDQTLLARDAFGSKAICFSLRWEDPKPVIKAGTVYLPLRLFVQDLNGNVYQFDSDHSRFRRPLGGTSLPTTMQPGGESSFSPSAGSSSSTANTATRADSSLPPTTYAKCPLAKPVALPWTSGPTTKKTSEEDDKAVCTNDMFDMMTLHSELKFTETRVDMMWDAKRMLTDLLTDGQSVVFSMQHGAHIMKF
ncbi:hypothetical protein IAU59_006638 [Kwoniella sp. CBS 9459]